MKDIKTPIKNTAGTRNPIQLVLPSMPDGKKTREID